MTRTKQATISPEKGEPAERSNVYSQGPKPEGAWESTKIHTLDILHLKISLLPEAFSYLIFIIKI